MAINKLPDARDLELLRTRMSTQFQIPSAYDDALSYQGLIYKLIQYLKDTMQNVEDWNLWLEDFVSTFDTRFQDTVRDKFLEMYDNGNLAELTAQVIDVVQDQIDAVDSRVDDVQDQIDTVDSRVDTVDSRVDGVGSNIDNQIVSINSRVDGVDSKIDNQISGVNSRVDGVNSRVDGVNNRVDGVNSRVDGVDSKIDNQIDEMDNQLTTQLAQKADKSDIQYKLNLKRDNSVPISLNDADSDFLSAIQGGTPVEVLSIPRDYSVTPKKTTFIDNRVTLEMEFGSITNGVNADVGAVRLRSKNMLKNHNGLTIIRKNINLQYGVSSYVDGTWDGVDYGWINNNEMYIEGGKDIRLNIKKNSGLAFSSGEIENIHNDFEVRYEFRSANHFELEEVKSKLFYQENLGTPHFIFGSFVGNELDSTMRERVRTKDFIRLYKGDTIVFHKDTNVFSYGVSVSNLDGTWNEIDYGWLTKKEFIIPHDSLVMINLRYTDNHAMTDIEFNSITNNAFTITTTVRNKVNALTTQLETVDDEVGKKEAINSILIEYGRLNGASYVFARIPKVTNNGSKLFPKVSLTSTDGSLSGTKRPTLRYARDNNSIFALNAGLFNVTTNEPVGQLIINGVSIINTPMTSDNGIPIHPDECYPLAIDSNGNLTTYPRNADTSNMIADGVQYAVTAWGKLVDNFEIATTDIENEIVHNGKKYIRQSIGQYQNGDYCVCTVDMTRGTVTNESGLYYEDLAQIFVDKGVEFAYSLDGGGSAQTVLGKRQLNPIYEGVDGRSVPTVIEFYIA